MQVTQGSFHTLVIREGMIPQVDATDRSVKSWTTRKYYEVCVNQAIYNLLEKKLTASMPAFTG